ncbi:flavin reductase family protein [Streptomyces sp. NPDC057148]|uniref:flavin reductase family protein n=1 Tax=unclassified Streptomyces TaxID=2593676 RepID=UPI00363B31DA
MPAPTGTPPQMSVDTADAATFRSVLGQVPTAVSVVTATTPEGPVGVTVGSFTSVALDPPLVVFYAGLHSASAAALAAAGAFLLRERAVPGPATGVRRVRQPYGRPLRDVAFDELDQAPVQFTDLPGELFDALGQHA